MGQEGTCLIALALATVLVEHLGCCICSRTCCFQSCLILIGAS